MRRAVVERGWMPGLSGTIVSSPFTIKPKHWWSYLNPWWWRRKRMIEAFMNYQWDKMELEKKFASAINEAVMYGEGYFLMEEGE